MLSHVIFVDFLCIKIRMGGLKFIKKVAAFLDKEGFINAIAL